MIYKMFVIFLIGCLVSENLNSAESIFDLLNSFGSLLGSVLPMASRSTADFDSIQLIFYYGPSLEDHQEYKLHETDQIPKHPKFNLNQTTTCYIHGYKETQQVESVQVIINAYYKRGDHNLIVVDWSRLVSDSYIRASMMVNVGKIGSRLSTEILRLFDAGIDIDNFHLVGHSLGGQLAGDIGRKIIEQTNGDLVLKRITALDPAFPGFFNIVFTQTTSSSDALFVDIIHTDGGLYGSPYTSGHADFWPNGGHGTQPGCPFRTFIPLTDNDLCSHRRSWHFWAESVSGDSENGEKFIAQPYRLNRNEENVEMGLDCPMDAFGDYYLKTNAQSPFAMGLDGIDA